MRPPHKFPSGPYSDVCLNAPQSTSQNSRPSPIRASMTANPIRLFRRCSGVTSFPHSLKSWRRIFPPWARNRTTPVPGKLSIVHCPLSIQISASANSMASKGFRSSTPKQTSFVWGPILFKSSGGMNPPCGKVLPSAKRLDGASAGPPAAAEGVDDLLFNIFC